MNLRQIETFAAVMRCGSASRAAETLGVTQPAVSRTIAELERAIGFDLFARIRNRLVPTPEARLLYKDVEAAFLGVDTIRASAARIRDRGSGELRVASLSALGGSLVPRAIARFRERHRDVRITLLVLPSREVRDLVASGQFDVGLAADEIDVSGVDHQVFLSRDALCAMPVGHPLADKEVIEPADLHDMPFVAYVPEDRGRQRLDAILETAGVRPRVVVETIYASTLYALVAEGVGVGIVSPVSVEGLDPARVALRRFEPGVQVRSLLILPADRPKSAILRDFIDALMAAR